MLFQFCQIQLVFDRSTTTKYKWIHQRSLEKPNESALPEKPAPFRASQIMRLDSATDILPNSATLDNEIVKPTSTTYLPYAIPYREYVEQ